MATNSTKGKKKPVASVPEKIETKKDKTIGIGTTAGVMKEQATAPKKETVKTVKVVAPKKTTGKKTEIKTSFSVQYLDTREFTEKELLKEVKEIWTKNYKRKISEIKTINYYIKQEEDAVYFVVNDEVFDKVDLQR